MCVSVVYQLLAYQHPCFFWTLQCTLVNVFVSSLQDENKVFDGASELQLDCMVEESSGSTTMKHDGLLSLADLSHPDDFPVPPHNGPSLTEMSTSLPIEPNDIKLDPAAGDTSASIGERKVPCWNIVFLQNGHYI